MFRLKPFLSVRTAVTSTPTFKFGCCFGYRGKFSFDLNRLIDENSFPGDEIEKNPYISGLSNVLSQAPEILLNFIFSSQLSTCRQLPPLFLKMAGGLTPAWREGELSSLSSPSITSLSCRLVRGQCSSPAHERECHARE